MNAKPTPRRAWIVLALGVARVRVAVFQRASLGVAGVEAQHRFGDHRGGPRACSRCCSSPSTRACRCRSASLLDRFGSRRLIAAGAAAHGRGPARARTAHTLGAGGRRARARRRRRRDDVHQRAAAGPAVVPAARVPLVTQLTGILGQVGQIAASFPLVALLPASDGRTTFLSASAIGRRDRRRGRWSALRDSPPGAAVLHPPVGAREALARLAACLARARHSARAVDALHHAVLGDRVRAALGVSVPRRRRAPHAGRRGSPPHAARARRAWSSGPSSVSSPARWPYRRSIPILAHRRLDGDRLDRGARVARPRAAAALLVVLVVVLAHERAGFDGRLRLRADGERGRADRLARPESSTSAASSPRCSPSR